jgi:hypothetical protein
MHAAIDLALHFNVTTDDLEKIGRGEKLFGRVLRPVAALVSHTYPGFK